jgi:hypothetical protein
MISLASSSDILSAVVTYLLDFRQVRKILDVLDNDLIKDDKD